MGLSRSDEEFIKKLEKEYYSDIDIIASEKTRNLGTIKKFQMFLAFVFLLSGIILFFVFLVENKFAIGALGFLQLLCSVFSFIQIKKYFK